MSLLSPLKLFLPAKWVAGLMVVFLAWQGVVLFQQRTRVYSEVEKVAVGRVCERAADLSVGVLKPSKNDPVTIGVTPLLKDSSGYFTDTLIKTLSDARGLELMSGAEHKQYLTVFFEALDKTASLDETILSGNSGFDVIAWSRVEKVYEEDGIGYAVLNFHLYDFRAGEWVLMKRIKASSREEAASWVRRHWKSFFCGLTVLLLPFLSFRALEKAAEKNSNAAMALVLVGLMAADLLLFWWAGLYAAPVAVPILGTLSAFFYNLWACDFMIKKVD
jgi:hypothetical protein